MEKILLLFTILVAWCSIGQIQGVSIRATNGHSYGALSGQRIIATNFTGNGIGLTNIMLTNPVIRGTFTNDAGLGIYFTDGIGLLKGHVTPYTGPNIPGLQFHAADVSVLQLLTNRFNIIQDSAFSGTITASQTITSTNTISAITINTTNPGFRSTGTNNLVLQASDGGTWILRVAADGALSTVTNTAGL